MVVRFAYVGSRTTRERNARGDGISVLRYDAASGALECVQVHGDLVNPSYLTLNRACTRLYTVHGDGQEVSVFAVHAQSGHLSFLQRQTCGGRNPVHLALSPAESHLVVSDHLGSQGGGSLLVLPLDDQGCLGPVCQRVELPGAPGPHRTEQPFSKPHYNPFDPSGRYVLVPDKGLDKVFSYRFANGQLYPADAPAMTAREGAGPRHLAFHPSQPWAYVINELDSTVSACHWNAETGALQPFQIVSVLADTTTGHSRAAAITVHPAGHTVYASNRGEDSIAVLAVDAGTGRLRLLQTMPSAGRTPRACTLSPEGRWFYALNEDSDSIVTLAVDAQSGRLSATGQTLACGSPVCLVFGVAASS